jgi:hypothetical protein
VKRLRKKDLQDKALEPSKAQILLSCLEEIEFELKMEVMKGCHVFTCHLCFERNEIPVNCAFLPGSKN